MTTAKKYLEILREREPQLWEEPLKESVLTESDLSEIEKGLGYKLPVPYREFLLSYKLPGDITVLVSFCGDSFACSWSKTFSREKNGYHNQFINVMFLPISSLEGVPALAVGVRPFLH